jgi:hypothetical protein
MCASHTVKINKFAGKKSLKIPKGYKASVIRRTENTKEKRQIIIIKRLQRKLKIEQHRSN